MEESEVGTWQEEDEDMVSVFNRIICWATGKRNSHLIAQQCRPRWLQGKEVWTEWSEITGSLYLMSLPISFSAICQDKIFPSSEFTHAFPFPGILFSIHSSGRAQLKYYFLVDISSKPLVMEESSSAGLICNYTSGAYHSYLWCFGKCLTISSLG